ncbi:hypothetical protein Dimus_008620 [Dionaea muscipula]
MFQDSLVVEGLSAISVISLDTVHLNALSRTRDSHSVKDPWPQGNRVKYRSSAFSVVNQATLEVWSSGWGRVRTSSIITVCTDTTGFSTHSSHSAHSVQVSGTGTRRAPANETLRGGPSTQLTQGRVYAIGSVSAPEVVADVETPGATTGASVARVLGLPCKLLLCAELWAASDDGMHAVADYNWWVLLVS